MDKFQNYCFPALKAKPGDTGEFNVILVLVKEEVYFLLSEHRMPISLRLCGKTTQPIIPGFKKREVLNIHLTDIQYIYANMLYVDMCYLSLKK